jgi:hypothetical protein
MTQHKRLTDEDLFDIEQAIANAFGNPKVHYYWVFKDFVRLVRELRDVQMKNHQLETELQFLRGKGGK